jgi:hypothetical protein
MAVEKGVGAREGARAAAVRVGEMVAAVTEVGGKEEGEMVVD